MPGPVDSNYPPPPPDYDPYADETTDVGGADPYEYPPEPTGASGYTPPEGGSGEPAVVSQQMLEDFQAQYDAIKASDLPYAEKNAQLLELKNILDQLKDLGEGAPIPQELQNQIDAFNASQAPGAEGEPPPVNVDDVKQQAEDLKTKIQSSANLSPDEKVEYGSQVDQILNQIELAGTDAEKLAALDVEGMKGTLTEIDGQVDAANQFSPGIKGLAEAVGGDMTPEKLQALAQSKGISLDNLVPPPSTQLLEFLQELIPDLKDKIAAVATAISDRQNAITTNYNTAKSASDGNKTGDDSADNDVKDMKSWQALYDLKYHQDDKSKAITDAKKAVTDALLPIFQALYPGQDVKTVDATSAQGFNDTERQYNAADQIVIGGTTVDLFNNSTGALQASTTPDADPAFVDIPPVTYDGEGDGAWNGPAAAQGVNTYGGPAVSTEVYDAGSPTGDDW